MKYHLRIIFIIFALSFTSSCVPLLIGGGVAAIAGGKMISQEKTVGQSISDTTIWTRIRANLANKGIDHIIMGAISIEVNEGRVLLTGTVPDKNKIITILKVCWDVSGVKEVINELQISGGKENSQFLNQASDAWITTKIKGKLFGVSKINSANYTVETINGAVYLFGTAQTQAELDETIDSVSSTKSVKKVVSYVRVKKNIHKKLSETKGNHDSWDDKRDKDPIDYNFDYSDVSPSKEIIKPNSIKPRPTAKADKIFEEDDY